jgi:hypothetical protein
VKLELVLKKELLQSGCELAPEDATQRGDGQDFRAIGRAAAGGGDYFGASRKYAGAIMAGGTLQVGYSFCIRDSHQNE